MSDENRRRTNTASPWWSEFHKTSRHYQGNKTHFAAYCRGCVQAKVAEIYAQEVREDDAGRLAQVRAAAAIESEGKCIVTVM